MPSDLEGKHRWLHDILHHIELAETFVGGLDEKAFSDDLLRLYAVTRCLEIISEASRRLPDAVKARHPAIPWKEMAAAGNIYRHEYEGVAAKRIWQTVRLALPALKSAVETELGTKPGA